MSLAATEEFTSKMSEDDADMDEDMAGGGGAKRRCVIPHRYLLTLMLSTGICCIIAIRTSFALVMTHVTAKNQSSTNLIFSHCPVSSTSADVKVDMRGDVMLMTHTALYVGVGGAILPAGILTTIISPKTVAGVGVLLNSIITLLLAPSILYSPPLVFCLRVLEGVFDAGVQCAANALVSAWSTDTDKTILYSITIVGFYAAPAVASLLTALTVCFLRWNAIFYILGGFGLLWCLVWFKFFYETPDLHPYLSSEERKLLSRSGGNVQRSSLEVFRNAPWRSMVRSGGVWAVINAVSVRTAIFAILILEQAQYFQDSFGVKIEDLGIILVLPYGLLVGTSLLGGLVSDKLIRMGLSTTTTRKLIFTIGYTCEGVLLLLLYFVRDWLLGYIFLASGAVMEGFGSAGYCPLISDMSPQYTGLIYGLTNALGVGVVGVFITTLISFTSGRKQSLGSWQNIFLLLAVMHFVGCVIFDLLADATLQPWAEGTQTSTSYQQADDTDNNTDDDDDDDDSLEMVDMSTTSLLAAHKHSEESSERKER